jgi:hypothetical protein
VKEAAVATQEKPLTPTPAPERESVLQRKCACGGGAAGIVGVCKECDRRRLTVQRYAVNRPMLFEPAGSFVNGSRHIHTQSRFGHHSFGSIPIHSIAPHAFRSKTAPRDSAASAEPQADQALGRPGLLVEDGAELGPGQMRKSEFIDRLEIAIRAVADAELARVGRSTEGCPYLEKWIGYYRTRSSEHAERALRRYAPEAAATTNVSDYIPLVTARVQQAVETWAKTGQITAVPEEVITRSVEGVLEATEVSQLGVGHVGPEVASEIEQATGGVHAKAREGGTRETDDPEQIRSDLGSGQDLESGVRSRMERAFGHDFNNVRVHIDARAAQLSTRLNARAFTIGSDVGFGGGEYRPGTLSGDALIAHELAHVIQQGEEASSSKSILNNGGGRADALEEDADVAAVGAVASALGGFKSALVRFSKHAMPRLRSGLQLQRCGGSHDYEIRGLSNENAPGSIFFDLRSSDIEGSQQEKIEDLKSPPAQDLRLYSFISEDENIPPKKGKELAHDRYEEVDKALRRNPNAHIGKQEPGDSAHPVEDTTSSRGQWNYRRWRKVKVVPASQTSSGEKDCSGGGEQACSDASKFDDAQRNAGPILQPAIDVLNTPLSEKAKQLLRTHFHTKADAEHDMAAKVVQANLNKVKTHIEIQMTRIGTKGAKPADREPGHVCANECDSGCASPDMGAYNNGVDDKALMTLCDTKASAAFMQQSDDKERALTLVHEGLHGVTIDLPPGGTAPPGKGAIDFAYDWQRLISFLDTATALKNNDSYVLFVREANGEKPKIGPQTDDPEFIGDTFLSEGERKEVERTIAWLSGWLIWSQQEIASLYKTINESTKAGRWTNPYYRGTMDSIADLFEMTKPPDPPTDKDQVKVAAIHDRLFPLSRLLFAPVELKKVERDSTHWGEGPTRELSIGPDFFKEDKAARSPRSQLDLLATKLFEASPNISKGMRPKYLTMLDRLRQHKGAGAP